MTREKPEDRRPPVTATTERTEAVVDRAELSVEQFETLARDLAESVRLEFIGGRVRVKAMPDGDHDEFIRYLMEVIIEKRPGWWMYPERGLAVKDYRGGRARPDGTLVPTGVRFAGQSEWADPSGVLMLVEVTSTNRQQDIDEKVRAYAATGIPIYMLIDRLTCMVLTYSKPVDGTYKTLGEVDFGAVVHLPEPVDLTIDTKPFTAWVG